METHSEIVNFLWGTANLIRDDFKRGRYEDVILPFTVLRRIDSVLKPTKDEVLEAYRKYKDEIDNLDSQLKKRAGQAFYNTSRYTFERLVQEGPGPLKNNLNTYIAGFSPNMREVIEKFEFRNTIQRLEDADLLYQVVDRFASADLHPEKISNEQMGLIFEELIRKFNEALDENPGEHFTPREVVQLMTKLVLDSEKKPLGQPGKVFKVCDPCCGTGGMLTTARDEIRSQNEEADVHLFGQEVNPQTWAICKSDLYMKTKEGRDADNIVLGSTLNEDAHRSVQFDFQLANPPYGKDWSSDKSAVEDEADRGSAGRFEAGTPRKSDGQLLFLQHMISHLKPASDGGGRACIIMNGSPLFTGTAGNSESEIRRWLLENDWVEAIIEMPEQLFYNTGISTYVWVVSNNKMPERRGKVQLIDASGLWTEMDKSLGDKRRYLSENQIEEVVRLYDSFRRFRENGEEDDRVQIFDTEDFGYRKIRVERPLRVNLRPSEDRIENLWGKTYFEKLSEDVQVQVVTMLREMEDRTYNDYAAFRSHLKEELDARGISIRKTKRTNILDALSEKDPDAKPARDTKGRLIADSDLRDHERVPLKEDVYEYFEREVKPHVEDAFIDEDYTDEQDGKVGRVGYEINFNRYFYEYDPPRPLDEIEEDLQEVQRDIVEMMEEVAA
jgi:type I restriction enzyme M protein